MLASIVSHLSDYQLLGKWFTAHHALMIMVGAIMVLGFKRVALAVASRPKRSGVVSLVEVSLVWLRDEVVYPWLGDEKGRKYIFFFWTLFFFILLNNLIGLVPAPFNLWHRTATGNLAVTGALAFIAFVLIQVAGMKQHGWVGYWINLVPGGVPKWLWPLVWVVEFVGLFTKPFALTVRLFANMTAGHTVILSLVGLIFVFGNMTGGRWAVAAGSVGMSVAMMMLEIFVAFLQAFIFAMLTSVFVGLIRHAH